MKKILLVFCMLLLMGGMIFIGSPVNAKDWRFPVSLTYVNGFGDVGNYYKERLEDKGYIVTDVVTIPVGLSFHPYLQLDSGFRAGAGMGPMMFIVGDASYVGFPLNLNVGYTLFPSKNVAPYIKGGLMYHAVSGDYVKSSTPGFFFGTGVEFFRKRAVGFGIEMGYDTSEVKFEPSRKETEKIKPIGFMMSLFVVF